MSWLPGDVTFVTNSPIELNFSANGYAEPLDPVTPSPLQVGKGGSGTAQPFG